MLTTTSPSISGWRPSGGPWASPSRMANARTSVGWLRRRKTRFSSWISRSSVRATESSTPERARSCNMRSAQRRTTTLETPTKGPFRTETTTGESRASPERDLLAILDELLEPDVGERVVDELLDHFERHGADVGAELSRLKHVDRAAHAGHEHFRVEPIVLVDGDDLLDELHPFVRCIVDATDEG